MNLPSTIGPYDSLLGARQSDRGTEGDLRGTHSERGGRQWPIIGLLVSVLFNCEANY